MTEPNVNLFNNENQNEENIKDVNLSSDSVEEISIYNVFSKSKRRLIVVAASMTAFLFGLSDTTYVPSIEIIATDLNTTVSLVNLSISFYLLFAGISSLIWGVVSDRWGRNISLKIGLSLFLISSIACIFSVNVTMLILLRTCQGTSIAVTMVVGQSVIADTYPPNQRGLVAGVFFIVVLIGVAIGPTVGGIIAFYFSWRAIFVVISIVTLIILIIYVIVVPETHQYYVMMQTKNKLIVERNQILKPIITNPFLPFTYFINLNVMPYILSASTAFATIIINQCLLGVIESQPPYYFNELKIGISYIPINIGDFVGSLLGGYGADKADKLFRTSRLENRLIPATLGYLLMPIGLIIFGWTFQYGLNILIPIISASVVAIGQAFYRPSVYSYLTIKEQQNSATVLSANNSLNYILSSIGLSVAVPLINAIDLGPFFTIIALIDIMAIIPTIYIIIRNVNLKRTNYQSM